MKYGVKFLSCFADTERLTIPLCALRHAI